MIGLMRWLLLMGLGVCCSMSVAHAHIYSWVDAHGVTNFSDSKGDPNAKIVWRDPNGPKGLAFERGETRLKLPPEALLPHIHEAANSYQLEPALLAALVATESAYNPRAKSPKGAMGLTQLMPATARRFGVKNPWDVRQNLHGGARYLSALLAMFDNDVQLSLAAFNAGEGAVLKYGRKIPPYAETQFYVPQVLAQLRLLRQTGQFSS